MTYKQIEASREVRLWIGQVIVPAAAAALTVASIPQVREFAKETIGNVKAKIKRKKFKVVEEETR